MAQCIYLLLPPVILSLSLVSFRTHFDHTQLFFEMTEWKSLSDQSNSKQFRDVVLGGGLREDVTTTTDPISALIQNMENLRVQLLVTHRRSGCYTSNWPEWDPTTKEIAKPNTDDSESEDSKCLDVHKAIVNIMTPEEWKWLGSAKARKEDNQCGYDLAISDTDTPLEISKEPCAPVAIEGLFEILGQSPSPAKGSDDWELVRQITYDMSYYLRKLQKKAEQALERTGRKSKIYDGAEKFKVKRGREVGGALAPYLFFFSPGSFWIFWGDKGLWKDAHLHMDST